jgi:DNA-binding response OmpR family regulator
MSKVMLIEDDATMIGLLKTLLGIEGYDVVAFNGDDDVLQAVRREKPDVVLLDVNLKNFGIKDITGFDLLKDMRADDELKNLGVVMSSGMNYHQESKEAGADGFVMKPYMPDDLLNQIKEIISNKK